MNQIRLQIDSFIRPLLTERYLGVGKLCCHLLPTRQLSFLLCPGQQLTCGCLGGCKSSLWHQARAYNIVQAGSNLSNPPVLASQVLRLTFYSLTESSKTAPTRIQKQGQKAGAKYFTLLRGWLHWILTGQPLHLSSNCDLSTALVICLKQACNKLGSSSWP